MSGPDDPATIDAERNALAPPDPTAHKSDRPGPESDAEFYMPPITLPPASSPQPPEVRSVLLAPGVDPRRVPTVRKLASARPPPGAPAASRWAAEAPDPAAAKPLLPSSLAPTAGPSDVPPTREPAAVPPADALARQRRVVGVVIAIGALLALFLVYLGLWKSEDSSFGAPIAVGASPPPPGVIPLLDEAPAPVAPAASATPPVEPGPPSRESRATEAPARPPSAPATSSTASPATSAPATRPTRTPLFPLPGE
jgi:hypothetical protein